MNKGILLLPKIEMMFKIFFVIVLCFFHAKITSITFREKMYKKL